MSAPQNYTKNLHDLAQVCRRWWVVIKSSPALWPYTGDAQPKWAWTAVLRCSRTRPLDVLLTSMPFDETLWAAAVQHVSRWRDVRINAADTTESLYQLERFPAPKLRDFTLSLVETQDSIPMALDLFSGQAPNLSSLDLHNVTLRSWDSPFLAGLTSLTLVDIRQPRPTVQQLVCALQASPDLTTIRLDQVFNWGANIGQGATVVILRQLRSLRIAESLGRDRCPSHSAPGAHLR